MAARRANSLLLLSKFTPFSFIHLTSLHRFSSSSNIPPELQRVGFIGLGNMGARMANNLIKAGYDIAVHDVNPNVMKMFSEKGILTKESPSEVTETSDVVITMLPSPKHVMDVYTGPYGLLRAGNQLRPWLFIDSSTIDAQTSRKVSAAVSNCSLKEKKGKEMYVVEKRYTDHLQFVLDKYSLCSIEILRVDFRRSNGALVVEQREYTYSWDAPVMLDAPVSGGVLAAEHGTLTFMAGGSEEAYLAAKTLFLSMGKNTIYCGPAGTGSAAKICNNLAMAVSMLGVSEGFALGQSLGLSSSTLTKIFNSSSARCWSSDTYNPVPGVMDGVPSSRNYEGGFASKLMAKDLNLAAASAKEVGLKCPLTSQAEDIFTELCDGGHATKDFSCVFRHYYAGKDEL